MLRVLSDSASWFFLFLSSCSSYWKVRGRKQKQDRLVWAQWASLFRQNIASQLSEKVTVCERCFASKGPMCVCFCLQVMWRVNSNEEPVRDWILWNSWGNTTLLWKLSDETYETPHAAILEETISEIVFSSSIISKHTFACETCWVLFF